MGVDLYCCPIANTWKTVSFLPVLSAVAGDTCFYEGGFESDFWEVNSRLRRVRVSKSDERVGSGKGVFVLLPKTDACAMGYVLRSYAGFPRRVSLLTFGNGNGLDEDDGGDSVDNDISLGSHVDSLGESGREHHGESVEWRWFSMCRELYFLVS